MFIHVHVGFHVSFLFECFPAVTTLEFPAVTTLEGLLPDVNMHMILQIPSPCESFTAEMTCKGEITICVFQHAHGSSDSISP